MREHNRKLRKEAKKKGVSKHVKKDPGVPSSAPFKEEVLREAEQRRLQVGRNTPDFDVHPPKIVWNIKCYTVEKYTMFYLGCTLSPPIAQ